VQDLVGPAIGTLALVAVGGYLLGSIPFGLIATRLGGAGDMRSIGSGNIGATNVLRSGRKDLALITLLGDGGKGAVAVLIAALADPATAPWWSPWRAARPSSATCSRSGWLQGRQGRGDLLRGAAGRRLAGGPAGRGDLAAGGLPVPLSRRWPRWSPRRRRPSTPCCPWRRWACTAPGAILLLAIFMAVLIWIRHAENIGRLLKGAEPRIGAKNGVSLSRDERFGAGCGSPAPTASVPSPSASC
jgi:glycerol-3-phosphate acyltransferase PlsY